MTIRTTIGAVQKRDGRNAAFNQTKITNAIFKAAQSVGGEDYALAQQLSDLVVQALEIGFADKSPTIEDIQDTVERVLIETGHAKTAKAYILYREHHAKVRDEKKLVLEKDEIDEVDKQFDVNALRVLKSRYLNKDENGKLIETPKQLFTRVAVHAALPSIFYDPRVFDLTATQKPFPVEHYDEKADAGKINLGQYALNRWHLEGVKRMYDRFNRQKNMKVSWTTLLSMLKKGDFASHEKTATTFIDAMTHRTFMPNTPAIANFGAHLGMGSACFVLDVGDTMEEIMDTLKATALIHKSGGGTGFNFSKLRPEGDFVSTTKGTASGPLSFMRLFDTMTDVVKQGGMRRGANMGILNSNHPDIEKFVKAKEGNKALRNFNISVLLMPDFWEHYEKGTPYPLLNPRTGKVVKTVDPRALFDKIVYQAWESAEPGVIFHDRVNEHNPFFKHLGPIVTTNPCGEVLLYPNEPCNLGSVNVWAYLKYENGKRVYDWDGLAKGIYVACEFLDNVIDVNKWPLQQIEDMALATRKIGMGLMGVADLLYDLEIPYNTDEGRAFMEKLIQFINYHSKVKSIQMAKERGSLPYYHKSFYPEGQLPFKGFYDRASWDFDWEQIAEQVRTVGIRNGYTIIIAPTGSISMIAGTSSGIEPNYSLAFEKNVAVGSFFYANPVFEHVLRRRGLYSEKLMEKVVKNRGSVQGIEEIPTDIRKTFVTAMDISPEDHIRALASFQKWVDSSISKTNNFPANATMEHMRESYLLAYQLGCKDVTVYRDGSIQEQVLVAVSDKKKEAPAAVAVVMDQGSISQAEGGDKPCPECKTSMEIKEGCAACPGCGYSYCS